MTERPDRHGEGGEVVDPTEAALARLDELLGELGRATARPSHPGPPPAEPPAARPPETMEASGPDRADRSFAERQAAARRIVQAELARQQREIAARRRSFDPERFRRMRARAAVGALPTLFQHALAADPQPAQEIVAAGRVLAALPTVLTATLAAELRREGEAAERERRARTTVASLHDLFTWAVGDVPTPAAMAAAAGLRAVFGHALADVPAPAPPEPEPGVEPDPPLEPPREVQDRLPPEPEPQPAPSPEGEPEPEPAAPERRRIRRVLVGAGAAVLVAGGLWLSGVFSGDDGGEARDAPPSFALTDGTSTASAVGQAQVPLVDVFAGPEGTRVAETLEHPTETGAPLVFLVTDDATTPERVEVLLPTAPPGARGWVARADLSFGVTDYRLIVRRGAHRLELWEGDELVLESPVAIGLDAAPEVGDLLYVKELLQPPHPDTVYGAYAFGLSGASNTLEKFSQGSGVVAIHGTNDPSLIGRDVETGSIRLTNTDIEQLVGVLPLGTPVEIR